MSQPLHVQVIQTLFRESLDVLLLMNAETGVIMNVNPAAARLLGYSEDQLVNQHFSILFPNETDQNRQDIVHKLRVSGAVLEAQTFMGADGTLYPMDVTAALVPWEAGKVIIVTLRDVSERQQAELLRLQHESLERELLRERELNTLKSRFMSLVSHEFRTPLTMILTSAELLERYGDKMPSERRTACLTTIKDEVAGLNQMLDDIALIIRAESGHLEFRPVLVDLAQMVKQLVDDTQANYLTSHQFTFQADGDFSALMLDATLLRSALRNLISNAIKYTPSGGRVDLRLFRSPDNEIIIEVTDSGIGIPPEEQPKLFAPYYRASNVGEIGGSGLGLKIVHDSIQRHGGRMEVESEVGSGTTMRIILPPPG